MRHQLDKLHYFHAIVQAGSFNEAAIRLHVTQPALSYAMKQLELHLGVTLLRRDHRLIELTEAGQTLATFCDRLFPDIEQLEERLRSDSPRHAVSFGTFHSIATYLVPGLDAIFADEPDMSLKIVTGRSSDIVVELAAGRLDLALVVEKPSARGLNNIEIYRDAYGLFTSSATTEKARPAPALVTMSDARDRDGRSIGEFIAELELPFARHYEVDSFDVASELIANGAGVGVLPHRVAKKFAGRVVPWPCAAIPTNRFGNHEFYLSVHSKSRLSARLVDRIATEASRLMNG